MNLLDKELKIKLTEAHNKAKMRNLVGTSLGNDTPVIVRFFIPESSIDWLITEGQEEESGDWLLYGLCRVNPNRGWEWEHVTVSELEKINLRKPFFSPVRDMMLEDGETVGSLMQFLEKKRW